ncbi:GDSL esterase/lipase APG [Bienertia sinuspersici]
MKIEGVILLGLMIIGSTLISNAQDNSSSSSTTLVPAIITLEIQQLMWETMTSFPHFSRQIILLMAEILPIICLLVDFVMANLPLILLTLGFTTYPAAYLSPQASGKNLLLGVNFASAASGYDDKTAALSHAIPLSQQLAYYKEYQGKLAKVAGSSKAKSIIKDALYIVGFGSSDFVQNYYVNPFINKLYTPDQYSSYLVGFVWIRSKENWGNITSTIRLHTSCHHPLRVPSTRLCCTAYSDAQRFNQKLNSAATKLTKDLPGLKLDLLRPGRDVVGQDYRDDITFV